MERIDFLFDTESKTAFFKEQRPENCPIPKQRIDIMTKGLHSTEEIRDKLKFFHMNGCWKSCTIECPARNQHFPQKEKELEPSS